MLTRIKCPLCEKEFELNKALNSDSREQILATVKEEHQRHLEEARQKAIEETKHKIDEDNRKKMEEVRKQAFDEAVKTVSDNYSTDFQFMKKQLEEKENKVMNSARRN
jgi:hypothetical protein